MSKENQETETTASFDEVWDRLRHFMPDDFTAQQAIIVMDAFGWIDNGPCTCGLEIYGDPCPHHSAEAKESRRRALETTAPALTAAAGSDLESMVYRWIERNHPDGFIDSLSVRENLERISDRHDQMVTVREAKIRQLMRELSALRSQNDKD